MLGIAAVTVLLAHRGVAGLHDDPAIYLSMASDPLGQVVQPTVFAFRILTPAVVNIVPLNEALAFEILTALALAGTAILVRRTAHGIGGFGAGLLAGGLFLGTGATAILARTPYMADPLTLLLDAAALEAGRRKRWWVASALVAVGVTNRETTLFVLLPLTVWSLISTNRRERRVVVCALWLPALAVLVLFHVTPLLYGRVVPTSHQSPGVIIAWNTTRPGGFGHVVLASLLSSLGLLWFLTPLVVRRAQQFTSCILVFLLPVLASTLIASDWPRLLAVGAVVIAPATAIVAPRRLAVAAGLLNPLVVWFAVTGHLAASAGVLLLGACVLVVAWRSSITSDAVCKTTPAGV